MYPSNHTLDGSTHGILVLGSCEFMHDGDVRGMHFYVVAPDWLLLQIWRPVSTATGGMQLVYQKLIDANVTDDVFKVNIILLYISRNLF